MGRHNHIRHRKPQRLIVEAATILMVAAAALGLVWVSATSRDNMRRDPGGQAVPTMQLPPTSVDVAPQPIVGHPHNS